MSPGWSEQGTDGLGWIGVTLKRVKMKQAIGRILYLLQDLDFASVLNQDATHLN